MNPRSPIQSNTQEGIRRFTAGEDLTGKSGYLVEVRNTSGKPEVFLPNADTDVLPYVLDDDAALGKSASVMPLTPLRNVRLIAKGTINPGDQVTAALVATAADKGKVRVVPGTTGTYNVVGIAENGAADGEQVLVRPFFFVKVVA